MGTVLVVDDDAAVCKLVSAVLARDGMVVESAEDGPTALSCLAERDYALVLTDMTMPGMSGLELIRAAEEAGHAVPFLVMSAYLAPATEQSICADPGVVGVIRKPFEIQQLVTDVRAVLDRLPEQAPVEAAADEPAPEPATPEPVALPLVPLELFVLAAERLRPRRLAGMQAGMRVQVAPRVAARRAATAAGPRPLHGGAAAGHQDGAESVGEAGAA
ncbi:MAG: response regulator [Planctomycetota bacterium]|jgi:CheY-like chemotaxis protein